MLLNLIFALLLAVVVLQLYILAKSRNQQSQAEKEREALELQANLENNLQNSLATSIQSSIENNLQKYVQGDLQLNLQQNLNNLSQTLQTHLDSKLQQNFNLQNQHFNTLNTQNLQNVSQKLGQIETTTKNLQTAAKSIDEIKQIFNRTSSKSFGGFAEKYLETLLSQHLSQNSWNSQVKGPKNTIIDFVINLGDKKIGIDAKFPLAVYEDYLHAEDEQKEAKFKIYRQKLALMAKDIASKYYNNNFVDVLFLYLPSDAMFTEVASDSKLSQTLADLKVTLVSPVTILPMLLILQSYQLKTRVQANAEVILASLKSLKHSLFSFGDEFRKLGTKLEMAQKNYRLAQDSLSNVQNQITILEKPELESPV